MARPRHRRQRQEERLAKIAEIKAEHGCLVCGETNPIVLDFHHCDPEDKEAKVRRMVKDDLSWKRIQAEIDKCDVLCANHHRLAHHNEGG